MFSNHSSKQTGNQLHTVPSKKFKAHLIIYSINIYWVSNKIQAQFYMEKIKTIKWATNLPY